MGGTNQDRLVKKQRRAGIATYADANQYLAATYWAAHNARFVVPPLEPADFHLPLAPRLDPAHVFCLETPRVVGNDWVVRYDNRALQIVPTARAKRHTHPRGRVVVRETRTGELFVIARTPEGNEQILAWQSVVAATHRPAYHDPARPAPAPRPAPVPVPPAPATRARASPSVPDRWRRARDGATTSRSRSPAKRHAPSRRPRTRDNPMPTNPSPQRGHFY